MAGLPSPPSLNKCVISNTPPIPESTMLNSAFLVIKRAEIWLAHDGVNEG
jgi:hypothetical protein